jgi:hypothetical protein
MPPEMPCDRAPAAMGSGDLAPPDAETPELDADLLHPGSFARQAGWQKDYFRGKFPDGSAAPPHETRMRLKPFTRVEDEIRGWPGEHPLSDG